MKKQFYILTILSVLITNSFAQEPVTISFTSRFLSQSVHPEYITITNLTNGGDTTLLWPDTVMTMIPVGAYGLPAVASEFKLFQNVPNPVVDGSGTSFYKGYYGGENMYQFDPPNGGSTTNRYEVLGYVDDGVKEYLLISVDLNGIQPEGAAWSYILERNSSKR